MARGRRAALAMGAIATLLLIAAGIVVREPIRLELLRRRAAKDALADDFDPSNPTPAWRSLLDAGERARPNLVKLLRDPDCLVWWRTVRMIAYWCGEDENIKWLKGRDRLALPRFLFLPAYNHRSLWRGESTQGGWRQYWSQEEGEDPEPFEEGIDFLEAILIERTVGGFAPCWDREEAGIWSPNELKVRAVRALSAMLRPGETDHPGSPLAARIIDILGQTARRETEDMARFAALYHLALNSGIDRSASDPETDLLLDEGSWLSVGARYFANPLNLQALVHLDQAAALRVVGRLWRLPDMRPKIEKACASGKPLGPVPMPDLLPLGGPARRFLSSPDSWDRLHAAACVAEAGLKEEIPLVKATLEAETGEGERLFLRSCLLALGDEAQREGVEKGLQESPGDRIWGTEDMILLSGNRDFLEGAIEDARRSGFSRIAFEDFIEGLPRSLHSKLHPSSSAESASRFSGLSAWWNDHRDRISWDPAKRLFVVRAE